MSWCVEVAEATSIQLCYTILCSKHLWTYWIWMFEIMKDSFMPHLWWPTPPKCLYVQVGLEKWLEKWGDPDTSILDEKIEAWVSDLTDMSEVLGTSSEGSVMQCWVKLSCDTFHWWIQPSPLMQTSTGSSTDASPVGTVMIMLRGLGRWNNVIWISQKNQTQWYIGVEIPVASVAQAGLKLILFCREPSRIVCGSVSHHLCPTT